MFPYIGSFGLYLCLWLLPLIWTTSPWSKSNRSIGLSSVSASSLHYPFKQLELDYDNDLMSIWDANSPTIHEIARKRKCRDGRLPMLTNMENEGELTTYSLECGDTLEELAKRGGVDDGLGRRDTVTTLCTSSCYRNCYNPADYNPDPKDCSNATAVLKNRKSTWDVTVGGTTVVQWKTCIYTFTNQAHNTINFCDTAWGTIGENIAWNCGRWVDPPAKGGICTTSNFFVEAVRTPNMPGPSYTISFSTVSTDNFGGETPVGASSTNSVSGSSSNAASPTTTNSTGANGVTTTLGPGLLTLSNVWSQTLPGAPTNDGQDDPGQGQVANTNDWDGDDTHKPAMAVIIGATIGGIAALVLLVAVVVMHRRLNRREKNRVLIPDAASASGYGSSSLYHGDGIPIGALSSWRSSTTDGDGPTRAGAATGTGGLYPREKGGRMNAAIGGVGYNFDTTPETSPGQEHRILSSEDILESQTTSSAVSLNQPPMQIQDFTQSGTSQPLQTHTQFTQTQNYQQQLLQVPQPSQSQSQHHPRSMEALIAAAAPPNMSQEQLNILAANFVSLVRGRGPQGHSEDEDDDEFGLSSYSGEDQSRQPPPYQPED